MKRFPSPIKKVIKSKLSNNLVFSYSFLLAFCSFFYELSLAQLLSSLLGGTNLQYAITVGIFTFSLGLGTLFYGRIKKRFQTDYIFFRTEIILIFTVLISPFMMILLSQTSFWFIIYIPIFLIGTLTGVELPLLIDQREDKFTKILAADYLGMIASSLIFPLLFFPFFGLLPGLYIVSTINLFTILFLVNSITKKIVLSLISVSFLTCVILNIENINSFSSSLLELTHGQ